MRYADTFVAERAWFQDKKSGKLHLRDLYTYRKLNLTNGSKTTR